MVALLIPDAWSVHADRLTEEHTAMISPNDCDRWLFPHPLPNGNPCPSCGASNTPKRRGCTTCGTRLDTLVARLTTCPTCGAGGPTTGTDLPCDCPPPVEKPDPEDHPETRWWRERLAESRLDDPEPEEPEADTRLVEARFALERARAHLEHVEDRMRSDDGGAWYLAQALAQITTAMSALP